MLCISRYVPNSIVWVYDTDTHIEISMTSRKLIKKLKSGVHVEGASYEEDTLILEPYQFDYSPDIVRGVLIDKVLYQKVGKRLVYLKPMRDGDVVLSDYALKLGRSSLIPVSGVRYVFDEKLKDIEIGVFRWYNTVPVMIACSELSDSLALSLYESLQPGLVTIEDYRDRSFSMRSIAAIKSRCFARAYQIAPAYQQYAYSVLSDLILPHFPQGDMIVKIRAIYREVFGFKHGEDWRLIFDNPNRSYFVSLLASKKVIYRKSEYNAFIRALCYVFAGGEDQGIKSLLDNVFGGQSCSV